MSNLQLVTQESFGNVPVDFYRKSGEQVWMTREQIGTALEYADVSHVAKLHARHKDRLDQFSTYVKVTQVEGDREVTRDVILYSPKGVYEICRWSRQPKANAFYDWVYDILEKLRTKEATMIDAKLLTQILQALADTAQRTTTILADHDARIARLEQRTSPQTGTVTDTTTPSQLAPMTPDVPTKILAAIYNWALRYQHHFYGRHQFRAEDFDCWGRWDSGNWKYLSIYPDKIRYLIGLYGGESDQTLRAWRDRGWLETNSEHNRFTKTVRLGSIGPVRLVSIKRHALGRARRAIRG